MFPLPHDATPLAMPPHHLRRRHVIAAAALRGAEKNTDSGEILFEKKKVVGSWIGSVLFCFFFKSLSLMGSIDFFLAF
jgi:hypothetical protein